MKERLIAFTRNDINKIWITLPMIVFVVVALINSGVIVFLINSNLILQTINSIVLIASTLAWLAIWTLFEVDETKMKKNKIFLILLSEADFIWFPMAILLNPIGVFIMTLANLQSDLIFVYAMIITAVAILCSGFVAKYFSKKLK